MVPASVRSFCSVGRLVRSGARAVGERARLGEAEVEQLRARRREDHVGRLEVAVDDAAAVRAVEGFCDLDAVPDRFVERQVAASEPLGQALALEILHHQVLGAVLVADVVQRADVRVAQARDRLRLALEPRPDRLVGGEAIRQHLDRDEPVEPRVEGTVDLAHSAGAHQLLDLVRSEPCSCF